MVEVKKLHKEIKDVVISNLEDVLLRPVYYTHKYRIFSEDIDLHLGIFVEEDLTDVIQIYVGDKTYKIREKIYINNNKLEGTELTIRDYEAYKKQQKRNITD